MPSRLMDAATHQAEALAALHAEHHYEASTPWSATSIATLLASEHGYGWVVEGAGGAECVAMLLARIVHPTQAEMLELCVAETHRRQGIASRLLLHAEAALAATGVEHLVLEVSAANEAAIHCYAKQGFACTGRRKGYYRAATSEDAADALLMAKECRLRAR